MYRVPGGYGGIAFLLSATFVRAFLTLAAMIALMALFGRWQSQMLQSQDITSLLVVVGSFMCGWFVIFYQFMPFLGQLRFLRTLPISATSLAAVLIAVATLPLIALGVLVTTFAWLVLGTPAALTVLSSYTFILAPAALCVFVAVWRGGGKQAHALLLLTLFRVLFRALVVADIFPVPGNPVPSVWSSRRDKHSCGFPAHALRYPVEQSRLSVSANTSGNLPWGRSG